MQSSPVRKRLSGPKVNYTTANERLQVLSTPSITVSNSILECYDGPIPFLRNPVKSYEKFKMIILCKLFFLLMLITCWQHNSFLLCMYVCVCVCALILRDTVPFLLIKLSIFVAFLIIAYIVSRIILLGGKDPHTNYGIFRRGCVFFIRIITRIMLFIWGFYYIPTKKCKYANNNINDEKIPDDETNVNENATIVVVNHHTLIDGLILFAMFGYNPCAKREAKHIPFFGVILRAIQTLFIDRHTQSGRDDAISKINFHAQNPDLNPLVSKKNKTKHSIF